MEYYIGMYFWRLNKSTGRVGVYVLDYGNSFYWDESNHYQSLKRKRFENWIRWVSGDVFFREANAKPMQVKDARVKRNIIRKGK